MKHVLLLTFFLSIATFAIAQTSSRDGIAMFENKGGMEDINVKIYPNPATSYIGLDQGEKVKRIIIFNIVGRRQKDFEVTSGNAQYYIGDLPSGMYLVQLLGENKKILSTKRLNKR